MRRAASGANVPPMRILVLLVAALWSGGVVAAEPQRFSLAPADVGVRLEKPAGDGVHFSQGSGVYLGGGLVLTAAHVLKVDPAHSKVTVLLDGRRVDGVLVSDGEAEKVDLALVKLPDEALSPARLAQPAVPVCAENPGPSQPVVVASMGTVSNAATIATAITSDLQTGGWTNLLSTGYHQGNSGGGVFQPERRCLWGIINLELSGPSITDGRPLDLTAFVPASKIAPFLKAYAGKAGAAKK